MYDQYAIQPYIDAVAAIAERELPAPRTLKVNMWDDGDFQITIFHSYNLDYEYDRKEVHYHSSRDGVHLHTEYGHEGPRSERREYEVLEDSLDVSP